jgi:hypothetical protein
MNQPMTVYMTTNMGTGERSHIEYAKLYEAFSNTLLIAATKEYVVHAIEKRGYVVITQPK